MKTFTLISRQTRGVGLGVWGGVGCVGGVGCDVM